MGLFNEQNLLSDTTATTTGKRGPVGPAGVGYKLDSNGNYDLENKKLVNVKPGTNNDDVVTKSQLDTKTSLLDGARTHGYIVNNKAVIYSQSGAVHANLQDQNEDEVRILTDNQDFDDVHLFVPNLKNFDGFGGKQRSEIMVTSVDQTVSGNKFFQNIKAPNPSEDGDVANKNYVDFEITKQNVLIDNEFVKKSGSLMTGDLILPHYNYPVKGNTNKAISYETQREIFTSRKETFPMETSLDMNNNVIENIAEATSDHQALRKSQLDNALVNINNDLSDKADKSYVDTEITKVHQNLDLAPFLKKDGQRSMTGDLNMDNNNIIRLKDPVNDADAVTKKCFKEKLLESHLLPSHHENAFKYLLDADESSSERNITVNGIVDFNNSPHKNKKAYDIDLIYTSGTQNYDSQIGINIYPLAIGKYTMIMEYYYAEDTGISVSCTASTAVIVKQTSKNFSDYIKLLVQFDQQTKDTPDYLYFNIRGSASTSTNPEGYLIFYGMKEWFDIVNPSIYDHALESSMFEYNNGNIKMNNIIDMDNHKIKNLSDGTDANDAINKRQFDTLQNGFEMHQFYIKNHSYISIFSYRFYDFKEPSKFTFIRGLKSHIVTGIDPGLQISSFGKEYISVAKFDRLKGLQFATTIAIIIDLGYTINQVAPYTIMISMTLKDNLRFFFIEPIQERIVYYPKFLIDKANSRLVIQTASNKIQYQSYSTDYNDEQIMIWINFSPSLSAYNMIFANKVNITHINTIPSSFSTNKLKIYPGNNIINKICYQNQHISNNNDYAQILFEEKKNGSYFK